MIIVKGYGQMCNNILQYAHLYAFGREYGITTISMRFAYKYRYFALCKKWYHNPVTYLLAKILILLRIIPNITADSSPEVDHRFRSSTIIACGGWGCRYPDLFQKYRNDIKQLFTIDPTIRTKVEHNLKQYPRADISLGLHIRRGDYARWMGGKFFFGDEVYHRLIREFCALYPDKTINVYICTNDTALDLQSYLRVHPRTFLMQGSGIEDLCVLAQCDYIIGVKSTFSLWSSFYRDIPLYWIMDKDAPLSLESFRHFDELYMSV